MGVWGVLDGKMLVGQKTRGISRKPGQTCVGGSILGGSQHVGEMLVTGSFTVGLWATPFQINIGT